LTIVRDQADAELADVNRGIESAFHSVPLHSSPAGRLYGRFNGEDVYASRESERLLRLPLFYGLADIERTG